MNLRFAPFLSMQKPAYGPADKIVDLAPDGQIVAYTVY